MSDGRPGIRSWDEIVEERQDRYEEAVVRQIAKKLHITPSQVAQADPTGEGQLTVEALVTATSFPVWLAPRHLGKLDSLEEGLEKRITKTPVWSAFQDALDDLPDEYLEDRMIAVIFKWPRHGKYFVFHNMDTGVLGSRGRYYRIGKDRKLHFLEQLDDFLESLGPMENWNA
jgi:hypothetical protein